MSQNLETQPGGQCPPDEKRLNILLSAYACRPGEGSEPAIAWQQAIALAQHHNIWVITRENNRPAIEAALQQAPINHLQFIFCRPGRLIERLNDKQRIVYLHYYLWQLAALQVARHWHQKIKFDLVHHLTYVRYSSPAFLSLLPIPFLWGPVGGAEAAPNPFWATFNPRQRAYELARLLTHRLGELDPFTGLTARRAVITWATTPETAKRLAYLGANPLETQSQLGLANSEITTLASTPPPPASPIRFISMARLLHWKGIDLGLKAFAQAKIPTAEYWIVGDGPERNNLETLAQHLGIRSQVTFWGKLSREDSIQKLQQCHALVHPSLHDSGGLVCLEAMAAGRPVLCLDLGGPALQVTDKTGIKVSAQTPKQTIQDLATALTQLAHHPEHRHHLGQTAQQHIQQHFNWDTKAQTLAYLYQELIEHSPSSHNSTPQSFPEQHPSPL